MPQIVRGSHAGLEGAEQDSRLSQLDSTSPDPSTSDTNPQHQDGGHATSGVVGSSSDAPEEAVASPSPTIHPPRHVVFRADSNDPPASPRLLAHDRRRSSSFFRRASLDNRPAADVYYDSRAATKREWRRRATTLQDYYHENPELLPQLPFTWHRGKKRWRLIFLISLMWIDGCIIPIALYYGLHYGGVAGWIIFAIVTTIWGGPTYLEFGLRTLKLMKKERFYRPLGTDSRWCFDYLTWVSVAGITAVTALFVIGSAPHIVWLRVLCMPMPALSYVLGILCFLPTLYYQRGWKAPFRLSSTGKGENVKPGVYYFIEDTVAVNANAGRPYREALAARWEASPRFRTMIYQQSLFWSIPAMIIPIPLTVIAVIHSVSPNVAYAICWAVPFVWATLWGVISLWWCKRDMVRERHEWESTKAPLAAKIKEATRGLDTERSSPAPPLPAGEHQAEHHGETEMEEPVEPEKNV